MSDMRNKFEEEALKVGYTEDGFSKYSNGEYKNAETRKAYYWFLTGVTYMCNDIKSII